MKKKPKPNKTVSNDSPHSFIWTLGMIISAHDCEPWTPLTLSSSSFILLLTGKIYLTHCLI